MPLPRSILTACIPAVLFSLLGCGKTQPHDDPSPPPPVIEATIAIDAATIVRDIPATIYGTNIEWINEANGIWDPAADAIKPWQVDLAQQAGISTVRFPGGFCADWYHWADGVGPRAARPSRPHGFDPGTSTNHFGTDELFDFCTRIGAEPLMQANVLTGTPSEAANWVTYCNVPTRRVPMWEIGNEQYNRDAGALTSDDYITRFLPIASAMRSADPGISIGAITTNLGVDPAIWDNADLITRLGPSMDFLAVHNAYAPMVFGGASDFWSVYQAMLGYPRSVERNLRALDQQLTTLVGDGGRITLAVTEWGPLFHIDPTNGWMDHCKTLGSALYAASVIQSFLRVPRVTMANQFKLSDQLFMGLSSYDGNAKAIWHAMRMYRSHFGTRLVGATVASPTFDAPAAGVLAAEPRVPYLDAVASLSPSGDQLFVIVVNKHTTEALTTSLSLSGFRPTATGHAWVLTAPSIDANNGNDLLLPPGYVLPPPVTAPSGSMFLAGAPGTVATVAMPDFPTGGSCVYSFPPLSVTAIELDRAPSSLVAVGTVVAP
ncbi:MAG: hypothetical protein H0W83_14850 [Planctomycetes bacterium]|nr:hypothetical protein [Planctomycetota bacterium]